MIKHPNICIAQENQLSKLPAMLLYEKRFVEMNKVALIARGSDTSTHLKLLPLDQRNMPSSHTINKNLSTHIFNGTGVYLCRRKKLISAHF